MARPTVTACLVYLNGIVGDNDVRTPTLVPKMKMPEREIPNRDYFIQHVKD